MYIKNVFQWVVPFLHRCESKNTGLADELLKEYLVTEAHEDLKYPLKIFQQSKPDVCLYLFYLSLVIVIPIKAKLVY